MGNYRPISLVPVFSKVFERLLAWQITKFLESNGLLAKMQFG